MANYFKQLNEAFDKKYGLNGVVESKRKLKEANTDWQSMDWDDQVNAIKRFVKNYRGTKVFEDFADSVGVDVDDVIDMFSDLEAHGIIYIPQEIQIDDTYVNNDLYESKRKLKEAKNDGIFSMTLSEYANSQGVDAKEAESWVTLHPEKTISKLYFSEDEECPYVGVEYTDGTLSVVGLRYDNDVDFSTMRKMLLSGSGDVFESKRRKLKEAKNDPLTSKPQSISSMLLKNKSAIDNADDLNALISAVSAALSSKKDDKKVKEIMAKLNTMPDHAKALTYLYNLILKGDNLGVSGRKKYEDYDDGNNEIDRYQKWVDFDMSRYGKISERTQQMVNKAGYQIIKDDHGDYEVAAGHFE